MVWRGIGVSYREVLWLPSLLAWLALPSLLALPANRGRLTSREGVFPRHCGVLGGAGCLPHRSTPFLLLLPALPALPAIVLLLAIAAHRASQLRMRTSACSSQTMTGLRTFNPKVAGSSLTGGYCRFRTRTYLQKVADCHPSHSRAPPCSAALRAQHGTSGTRRTVFTPAPAQHPKVFFSCARHPERHSYRGPRLPLREAPHHTTARP